MQHIYIATVRAAHDFNNVVWQQAYVSRNVASVRANTEAERRNIEADQQDPTFGFFDFRSDVVAVPMGD